jgi:glycosyltransferase involved in cell wall biosynthesis
MEPLISVVIPTRKRPSLVHRAAKSALRQTLKEIEVIVVIDGPDTTTSQALLQVDDPRLNVRTLPQSLGCAGARNTGVSEAKSHWIAFLDDDDEWFPQKLEFQLKTAKQSHHLYPIISCRVISRSEGGDLIWPRRYPKPEEALSEYLFCQRGLFGGEGLVLPSSILTKRDLLQEVPFKSGIWRHDDVDWLLRASKKEGVGVDFVSTSNPLLIWNMENDRNRISNTTDWYFSLSWIQANRHLVTPRAYASFLMIWTSLSAANGRSWKAFWLLPWKAYREGKPRIIDFIAHLVIWLLPAKIRRVITVISDRRKHERVFKSGEKEVKRGIQ